MRHNALRSKPTMKPFSRFTALVMLLCVALPADALSTSAVTARVNAMKQQALALYTLRMADQRELSGSTMMLLGAEVGTAQLQSVKVWVDGSAVIAYDYSATQAQHLSQGAMHQLSILNLSMGTHEIQVVAKILSGNRSFDVAYSKSHSLDRWPRGFSILLGGPSNAPQITLETPVTGERMFKAAQHEFARGHALKALALLQTMAHVDPARARTADYQMLLAQCLLDWGFPAAAEATFDQLGQSDAPQGLRNTAALKAAELAFDRGAVDVASQQLSTAEGTQSPSEKLAVKTLQARRLLARGDVAGALKQVPADGPPVWRFNLAATLFADGFPNPGVQILEQLGAQSFERPQDLFVRDNANLQLGYHYLRNRNAAAASTAFTRIDIRGAQGAQALLGKGWASLAAVSMSSGLPSDGFRPQYIQDIDAGMRAANADNGARTQAVQGAIEAWSLLANSDPMEPSVQEALVAIPYALAQAKSYARAGDYAERATTRINAVRESLMSARRHVRNHGGMNGQELISNNWPPRPASWLDLAPAEAWWLEREPDGPRTAYVRRFLQDPETVAILSTLGDLQDISNLVAAVTDHPDLKNRGDQISQRLEAERAMQQTALQRLSMRWLLTEINRTSRYLILSRLVLAKIYEQSTKE